MQSFVVQNFHTNYPFNVRTQRYVGVIRLEAVSLLRTLLTLNMFFSRRIFFSKSLSPSFTLQILNTFFIKPFGILFKKLVFTSFGLYSNNITKTLSRVIIQDLLQTFPTKSYNFSTNYLSPITVINFSFHKTKKLKL